MRRLRLTTTSSGGCTTNITHSDTWARYTALGQYYTWSQLNNGQCFRMQTRAVTQGAVNKHFYGALRY